MIPELGKYAGTVLGAYAVSILLIVGLTGLSILRARKMKRELDALESRRKGGRDG
jgi:heme exporter protein D